MAKLYFPIINYVELDYLKKHNCAHVHLSISGTNLIPELQISASLAQMYNPAVECVCFVNSLYNWFLHHYILFTSHQVLNDILY